MTRTCLLAACLLLPGAGCVTFEKETMVFVFPPDGKEVRGLLIYEGIRVSGKTEEDLKAAKAQLTQFVTSEQEVCLGDNWVTHLSWAPGEKDGLKAKTEKAMFRR